MQTPTDDLARWRPEFPILESTVYMISNSLGAMPRGAADTLAEYAETWATRGVRAWEERWWEMALEVGDKIGAIIGAAPGSVSMHPNVTTAEMAVLSCFLPGTPALLHPGLPPGGPLAGDPAHGAVAARSSAPRWTSRQ